MYYRQQKPYFEELLTRPVRSYVRNTQKSRLTANLAKVSDLVNDIIWQPICNIDESPVYYQPDPRFVINHNDSSDQQSDDDLSNIH